MAMKITIGNVRRRPIVKQPGITGLQIVLTVVAMLIAPQTGAYPCVRIKEITQRNGANSRGGIRAER